MLYLSRSEGEAVMIGDYIRLVVNSVQRNRAVVDVTHDYGTRFARSRQSVLAPGRDQHIVDGIKVVLRRTSRQGAKLGFKAPKGIPIHRQEVYDRVSKEAEQCSAQLGN